MQIIITKRGDGKIETRVYAGEKDLLEMLAAANAAISLTMLKCGVNLAEIADTLAGAASLGLDSAVDEWESACKRRRGNE